jgi:hypothetical protein
VSPTPSARTRSWLLAPAAIVGAFGTYFCMYGFRKPFTVATYSGYDPLLGIDFKTILVMAQVFGYMCSKFAGIRLIASTPAHRRIPMLLALIGTAELALVFFGATPAPYNAFWLFVNGLMLGMIFGLVMGFLEGRRNTELLLSALCVSFIVADGAVKSVGSWVMEQGVPEAWMPAAAGAVFLLPLLLCSGILQRLPPPDSADVDARSERTTMTADDRRALLGKYGIGIGLIVLVYLFVTILRSVRADFAPEIWAGLGVTPDPSLYTRSEIAVALGILVLNGSMVLIGNNRTAFFASLALTWLGLVLTVVIVLAAGSGTIPPFAFMVAMGFALYLPYIAIHTTVFERFIAMTRDRGTIGYLMYLADAFGYLGYVGVLLARQVFRGETLGGMLPFFLGACLVIALAGSAMMVPAFLYFRKVRSA